MAFGLQSFCKALPPTSQREANRISAVPFFRSWSPAFGESWFRSFSFQRDRPERQVVCELVETLACGFQWKPKRKHRCAILGVQILKEAGPFCLENLASCQRFRVEGGPKIGMASLCIRHLRWIGWLSVVEVWCCWVGLLVGLVGLVLVWFWSGFGLVWFACLLSWLVAWWLGGLVAWWLGGLAIWLVGC